MSTRGNEAIARSGFQRTAADLITIVLCRPWAAQRHHDHQQRAEPDYSADPVANRPTGHETPVAWMGQ